MLAGLVETLGKVPDVEVAVDFGNLAGLGVFPAQLNGCDTPLSCRDKLPDIDNEVSIVYYVYIKS